MGTQRIRRQVLVIDRGAGSSGALPLEQGHLAVLRRAVRRRHPMQLSGADGSDDVAMAGPNQRMPTRRRRWTEHRQANDVALPGPLNCNPGHETQKLRVEFGAHCSVSRQPPCGGCRGRVVARWLPPGMDVCGEPPAIVVRDLSFQHVWAKNRTLKGVSFKVETGSRVLLCGRNGAGKSTLLQ